MLLRSWDARPWAALLVVLLLSLGALDLHAQEASPAEDPPPESSAPAPVDDPELLWARIQQDELPSWTARREAAEARAAEARAFFAGGSSLRAAFPSLADGPLSLVGWLDSQLIRLEEAEAQRALARARAPPRAPARAPLVELRELRSLRSPSGFRGGDPPTNNVSNSIILNSQMGNLLIPGAFEII